jgi:hypothetical protein
MTKKEREELDALKKAVAELQQDDCPHCGRCKHCGRSDSFDWTYLPPAYPEYWWWGPRWAVQLSSTPDAYPSSTVTLSRMTCGITEGGNA